MNPTPPKEFVSALRNFDASLRLRWGVRTSLWIIERKMEGERHVQLLRERSNPFRNPQSWDIHDGSVEGYVNVMFVHPMLLDHRVFPVLADADLWRQGGVKKMADRWDEIDAAREAEAERENGDQIHAMTSDFYEHLAWQTGRRAAVTTPGEPEAEVREGYKVRDRRVTASGE